MLTLEARNRVKMALGYLKPGSFCHDALVHLAQGHSPEEVYKWALNSPKHRDRAKKDLPKHPSWKREEDALEQTISMLNKIVTGEISEGMRNDFTWRKYPDLDEIMEDFADDNQGG